MTLAAIRIIKLGGSLLQTQAVQRLPTWLGRQRAMRNVLIVGGGQMVDQIRETQRKRGLDDARAHWLSIQAMDINGGCVQTKLIAAGHAVRSFDSMAQIIEQRFRLAVFAAENHLRRVDSHSEVPLPENWTVSSDSIAARLAAAAGAIELVLLKSALPHSGTSPTQLAETGFVDDHFPLVADTPTIRIVNASGIEWPEVFSSTAVD